MHGGVILSCINTVSVYDAIDTDRFIESTPPWMNFCLSSPYKTRGARTTEMVVLVRYGREISIDRRITRRFFALSLCLGTSA